MFTIVPEIKVVHQGEPLLAVMVLIMIVNPKFAHLHHLKAFKGRLKRGLYYISHTYCKNVTGVLASNSHALEK